MAQVPSTADQVRPIVDAVIQQVSKEQGLLVDPRIEDEITASVFIFTSNFCYPANSAAARARCDKTIDNPGVMVSTVSAFLTEIAGRRPARIETVGSRLADGLNMNFSMIGWPSEVDNSAGIVDLPETWQSAQLFYRSANGLVALGSSGREALLNPGRLELIARQEGGTQLTQVVQVIPRSRTSFEAQPPATVATAGGVGAAPDDLCHQDSLALAIGAHRVANGPLRPFNWGRGSTFAESPEVRDANQAPFTKQTVLDINVVNQSQESCDANCMFGLGVAFAEAIAVWRGGCARCDPNALSIIRLGRTVWADKRITRRLRKIDNDTGSTVNLDLRVHNADELQTMGVPGTNLIAYEEISGDSGIQQQICRLDNSAAPWVRGAQSFECPDSSAAPQGDMRPVLTMKSGATSCGPSRAFIACGLPNAGIELTFDDVRYTIPTVTGPPISISSSTSGLVIDVRHVILHEVGHWFGVPHAEVEGSNAVLDIMGQVYGEGPFCVSGASMVMMNNASDLRWVYRVTAGNGLARPADSSMGR